jgi:Tfp pilus assembly protein PilO
VTARFESLSERAQVALVAGVLLLVAVLGYLVMIAPKHSTAKHLQQQAAAVQQQIDQNRSSGFTHALPAVRAASVFSLAKAMPTQLETPDLILQLNQLAQDSGISFDQIEPTAASATAELTPDTTDPFAAEPIQVQFTGSYYNFLTFLQRLHNLVRVENGKLFAAGRLFDVSSISFGPGQKGFPQIQATMTINAFAPQTATPAAPTTPTGTDTTSTTTDPTATTTTTTTTTSTPTSAAPSTSGGTS